ncbi:GvpL/GvpF family gas vesicle protein [Roseomonas sp. GC11]|uniref:GvpL/GvpF family gas vesicle protein n=1 Tax=Roseomonas sp. GC11 TaxID=2950546 RepID=UPI00272DDF84|nr:GvpL/GvpF family gas vesicle protein [Roseomonas sp. GC11]
MNTEAWYAYAVVAAGQEAPHRLAILPEAPLAALPAGPVALLASPVPRALFEHDSPGSRTADPDWVAARVQAHHTVVAAAGPCLPFAFGALFSGLAPLLDWAAAREESLAEALARLGQRAEWSLILREDAAAHAAHLCRTEPGLAALAAQCAAAGPGTGFLLGRRLEQALPAARAARLANLREELAVVAASIGLPAQPEPRPGRLTLLAGEAEIAALRPALEAWAAVHEGSGVALELSGPWPAYGFARAVLAETLESPAPWSATRMPPAAISDLAISALAGQPAGSPAGLQPGLQAGTPA